MARDRSSRRRRSDGSARDRREKTGFKQLPRRSLRNPYKPIEILQEEQIEAIHNTSLQILEEIGMDFLHPEALEILKAAGASVESGCERVRFDRGLIEEAIAKAPAEFTRHGTFHSHVYSVAAGRQNTGKCYF